MSATATEENKAIVRRLLEEAFGAGDLEVLDELLADGFVGHAPAEPGHDEETQDQERIAEEIERAHRGLGDLSFEVEQLVAEGNHVAVRSTISGVHDGEFMGAPPTGERVEFRAMNVFRLEEGEIAEDWALWDAFGLLQQLGMGPDGPPK